MSEIPSTSRVVIIGGGAVGVSCLYHLAKAGWTDCVLLEKNELTSGSTWHAAGNVPTFSASWSIMHMQRYSTELYKRVGAEVDYPMNYHVTGSLRVAHTDERMREFQRVKAMGRYQGMDIEIVGFDDIKQRYPFLETHDLKGALYDPNDGDIDPAQLTQALAKGAREMGAKIVRFCAVTGVRRDGDEWVISTEKGDVRCQYVVNAAGYRAEEVGRMFGREVPMMVMSHQYILFEEIPELAAWSTEHGRKLPLLRDVDSSYYLRQEKTGMNLGPYERNCRAHWATPDDPMPDDFSFQLYPDDLDRLEWYLNDAVERVPILGTAGLSRVINGPIPYTPDGNPLIGPMPGVPNAFEACVFTFGIAQSGGAGKVLAEWVTEGKTEWDMWSCDPRRFTNYTDPQYCLDKGMEIYGNEYAIHFPRHVWPAGRDRKLSPLHNRMKELGGQFGPYNGWERANWYAHPGDDTSEHSTETFRREGPWLRRVREECHAVRDHAGILDLPGFSRFRVEGEGARNWLLSITTGPIPKPGRIGLAYFADDAGRIVTEMSVMAIEEEAFVLITAAVAQWHDREWLEKQLPKDSTIRITDVTDRFSCQILTGPESRAILAKVADADLSKGWLTHQPARIVGRDCRLVRVSFAGELGWEIHSKVEDTAAIFDAVWQSGTEHGLRPFGMFALDSLRLEKGYRAWKVDLSTDYSILEGGLERFVRWEKPAFVGKSALESEKQQGVRKRFATMTVDAGEYDAPYMSIIWHGDQIVGETTSGGYGHRIDRSIALGVVRTDLAEPGTSLEIEIFGKRHRATVQPDLPLWDPQNERIRA
ncbi:dimethylglycine dehydrogenase precursor (plasmid) [Sinorhizobium fredii NGR234]|uniref:Dimethylglycine dehydrogenase n=1 Tax=Sinorhizobium fredii (strain NBRC 101917 / NGR234) TaxID=394 RepID=Q6W201_SINFN|nr:FAD-dependent oxidoreductase [Sinorhizobium fredii]AAQ87217.1 Dimethylglycine dehydrogenase [Sinorhizobium fredii NGR234]ACP23104.1 dimethylglycine dehydrogenase precursor [Sinorhizobium fredii NGR234]